MVKGDLKSYNIKQVVCSNVTVGPTHKLVTTRNPDLRFAQDCLRTLTGLWRIPQKIRRLHRHFHSWHA